MADPNNLVSLVLVMFWCGCCGYLIGRAVERNAKAKQLKSQTGGDHGR